MNPELEALVSADEQARARVREARETARAALARVAEDLAAARQRRARELEAALESEIEAIRVDACCRVEERRKQRAERRKGHRQAAEALLPAAEDAFVRILTGRNGEEGSA